MDLMELDCGEVDTENAGVVKSISKTLKKT